MNLLGFELTLRKKAPSALSTVESRLWFPWLRISESFAGAWQQNAEPVRPEVVLTHPTVYACVTLIATDIAKMRLRLMSVDASDIWTEAESPAFSPVLRIPNRYQTPVEFVTMWVISKLIHGNTYVLKVRDNRGIVTSLYILDPGRVRVLQSEDGSIWYELHRDYLSGVAPELVILPAREIIHDRMPPLFHPLVGVSPLEAAGLATTQSQNIATNSSTFFGAGAQPGGVLTVTGSPSQVITDELKAKMEAGFSGSNAGKTLVLADSMKYEPLKPLNATDAQLIEQMKWADEAICRAFHVPAYKVGVGPQPNYSNVEALNRQYYSECLQYPKETLEQSLDKGLELPKPYKTAFNLDDLLAMDTKTLIESEKNAQGLKTVNESRQRLNLPPQGGGDSVFRQLQDHSLEAIARRDEALIAQPLTPPIETPNAPPAPADAVDKSTPALRQAALLLRVKQLTDRAHAA